VCAHSQLGGATLRAERNFARRTSARGGCRRGRRQLPDVGSTHGVLSSRAPCVGGSQCAALEREVRSKPTSSCELHGAQPFVGRPACSPRPRRQRGMRLTCPRLDALVDRLTRLLPRGWDGARNLPSTKHSDIASTDTSRGSLTRSRRSASPGESFAAQMFSRKRLSQTSVSFVRRGRPPSKRIQP
jgi:hypothetical protein